MWNSSWLCWNPWMHTKQLQYTKSWQSFSWWTWRERKGWFGVVCVSIWMSARKSWNMETIITLKISVFWTLSKITSPGPYFTKESILSFTFFLFWSDSHWNPKHWRIINVIISFILKIKGYSNKSILRRVWPNYYGTITSIP